MDDASLSLKGADSRQSLVSGPRKQMPGGNGWSRVGIARIEDLSDAVYGAGLEAVQMSRGPISGSLAFAEHDGVVFSTGYIDGRVGLTGPLSESMITLGIGLDLPAGTRHWLNEVTTGDFGIFLPGDHHDAIYTPGSLYATVTLSAERLDAAAEARGLVTDLRLLGGTGVLSQRFPQKVVAEFRARYEHVHSGRQGRGADAATLGCRLLDAVLEHIGRQPRPPVGQIDPRGHARIVARARAYVLENLDRPLRIDEIASAAHASHRTVYRAFAEVLDESPQSFIRKLRLHRIRHDLASDAERACTVALAANRWGISELGRLSGWYRDLFGERPSDTLAQIRRTPGIVA